MSDDSATTGGYATRARVDRLERRVDFLENMLEQAIDALDQLSALVIPPPQAEDPATPDHTSG